MRLATVLLMSVTAIGVGHAAEKAAATAAPAAEALSCETPIGWDATEEDLKKQFGPENVKYEDVGGPEGTEMTASVVHDADKMRTLIVVWSDDAKRAKPSSIIVDAIFDEETGAIKTDASGVIARPVWTTSQGVRAGMTIQEVEKINGKPFTLSGFGWDYGGSPQSFDGGKLEQNPDTTKCWLSMTFTTTAENTPETVLGERDIRSDAKDTLAAKPVVGRYTISYMRPEEGAQ